MLHTWDPAGTPAPKDERGDAGKSEEDGDDEPEALPAENKADELPEELPEDLGALAGAL